MIGIYILIFGAIVLFVVKLTGGLERKKLAETPEVTAQAVVVTKDTARHGSGAEEYYVTFRTEDGQYHKFGGKGLYDKTAVGDKGPLTYKDTHFIRFQRTEYMEIRDCTVVIEEKTSHAHDPSRPCELVVRSDAFGEYWGKLRLECSELDLDRVEEGETVKIDIERGRITAVRKPESAEKPAQEGPVLSAKKTAAAEVPEIAKPRKSRDESRKEPVRAGAETAYGTVIFRRTASVDGDAAFVGFLLGDGRMIWARSQRLYDNTVPGDSGTVTCMGDSVLDFEPTEVLELDECAARLEKKGRSPHDPRGTYRMIFRSDAFALYGGKLELKCGERDFDRGIEGRPCTIRVRRDRVEILEDRRKCLTEYEGEKKPEETDGVPGRVIYRECTYSGGEYTHTVTFLSDTGRIANAYSSTLYANTAVGDYGGITFRGTNVLRFKREAGLEVKDLPALLVRNRRAESEYETGRRLTFSAGAFELYGGEITVYTDDEKYAALKKDTYGLLSLRRNQLLSFEPGHIGI